MASDELTITGIATAEVMDSIRNARVIGDVDLFKSKFIELQMDPNRGMAALIELIGESIYVNKDLVSAEQKLNYACSAAALLIAYTAELMRNMIESGDGRG